MIKDLGTIWHVLAACEPIDPVKFGDFCRAFTAKFEADANINWYQFSPTMHKILVHGQECIEFFPVPIGWLSEEV